MQFSSYPCTVKFLEEIILFNPIFQVLKNVGCTLLKGLARSRIAGASAGARAHDDDDVPSAAMKEDFSAELKESRSRTMGARPGPVRVCAYRRRPVGGAFICLACLHQREYVVYSEVDASHVILSALLPQPLRTRTRPLWSSQLGPES